MDSVRYGTVTVKQKTYLVVVDGETAYVSSQTERGTMHRLTADRCDCIRSHWTPNCNHAKALTGFLLGRAVAPEHRRMAAAREAI